jgi:hypothetical protein
MKCRRTSWVEYLKNTPLACLVLSKTQLLLLLLLLLNKSNNLSKNKS